MLTTCSDEPQPRRLSDIYDGTKFEERISRIVLGMHMTETPVTFRWMLGFRSNGTHGICPASQQAERLSKAKRRDEAAMALHGVWCRLSIHERFVRPTTFLMVNNGGGLRYDAAPAKHALVMEPSYPTYKVK